MNKNYFLLIILFTLFFLIKTPLTFAETQSIQLNPGWNMFSLPLNTTLTADSIRSQCGSTNKVWNYNPVSQLYEEAIQLLPGKGYWLKVGSACIVSVTGSNVQSIPSLKVGWNQIGTFSQIVTFNDIKGNCNVLGGPWKYNTVSGQYNLATSLEPGYGYWIKVSSDCNLGSGEEIPPSACSDGTAIGICSATKPKYCSSGTLINSCSQCGCPSDYTCNTTTNSCFITPVSTCDSTCKSQGFTSGSCKQTNSTFFYIHGADTGASIFNSKARNYQANAGTILTGLGINVVRLQCGSEGDIWGINMVNNAANDSWANHLESLLETLDSMRLKGYFYSLGDPWGCELGIQDPSNMMGSNPPMNIVTAESYIDKLAGNNKLNHNFITDPRIVVWSVANEAHIGTVSSSGVVTTNSNYNWIIQMCDYIRSKGGKVVVPSPVVDSTAYGGSSWDTAFRWTVPLLQGHVDYIENHWYGENYLPSYSLGSQQYNWTAWRTKMQQQLQEMIDHRGSFPVDNIILGEFGMWRGTGTDIGLTNYYFSDENRRDYYTSMFQAIQNVGLRNVGFHGSFEELGPDGNLAYSTRYGVIGPDGQPYPYVADIIRNNYNSQTPTTGICQSGESSIGQDGCSSNNLCCCKSDLVINYKFDEGSGTIAKDSSPFKNNATLFNSPVWVTGKSGKALQFNGSNYVESPDSSSLDLSSQVTITAWINPSSIGAYNRIAAKSFTSNTNPWTEYGLLFDNANHIRLEIATSGTQNAVNGATTIPLSTWTFVAGTYDGSTMKVYVNGVLDNSTAHTGTIDTNNMPLSIGRSGFGSDYFKGVIDEVKVWNRALTTNEIKNEYGVQTCSDGTAYGSCSSNQPLYCSSGTLINKCSQCSCPSGYTCNSTTGSCYMIVTSTCDSTCKSQGYTSGTCRTGGSATKSIWYGTGEQEYMPMYGNDPSDIKSILSDWNTTLTKMSRWKFNTIRLAMYIYSSKPDVVDYSTLDSIISLIGTYNMKVVIDFHYDYHRDYDNTEEMGSSHWYSTWQDLATHYKNNPTIKAFELWNEPNWRTIPYQNMLTYYAQCTDNIRAIDPSRIVVWQYWAEMAPYLSQYSSKYSSYVIFTEHPYASSNFATNDEDVAWEINQMLSVRSKGFDIWAGEMGRNDWDSTVTWQRSEDFDLKMINACVANNMGFSLWSYTNDHGFPTGTYDTILTQSNYSGSTTISTCQSGESSIGQDGCSSNNLCCCVQSATQCTPANDIIKNTLYPTGSCQLLTSYGWSHATCGSTNVCNQGLCKIVNASITSYTLLSGKYARSDSISIPYTTKNTGDTSWCFLTEAHLTKSDNTNAWPDKFNSISPASSASDSLSYAISCSDPLGTWSDSLYSTTDFYVNSGWNVWGTPTYSFNVVECLNDQDCTNCKGSGYTCDLTSNSCKAALSSVMLHVCGINLCDANGNVFRLKGTQVGWNEWYKNYGSTSGWPDNSKNPNDSWFNSADVSRMKQAGANSLELNGILISDLTNADGTPNEAYFANWVDVWVNWCTQNQMYCLVTMNAPSAPLDKIWSNPRWLWQAGGYSQPTTEAAWQTIICDFFDTSVAKQTAARAIFINLWAYIANRYKNNPYVIYGLMNEPFNFVATQVAKPVDRSEDLLSKSYSTFMGQVVDAIRNAGSNQIVSIDYPYVNGNGPYGGFYPIDGRSNIMWEGHAYVTYWGTTEHNYAMWQNDINWMYNIFVTGMKKPLYIGEYGFDPFTAIRHYSDWRTILANMVTYLDGKQLVGRNWHEWGGLYGGYYNAAEHESDWTAEESNYIIQTVLG